MSGSIAYVTFAYSSHLVDQELWHDNTGTRAHAVSRVISLANLIFRRGFGKSVQNRRAHQIK